MRRRSALAALVVSIALPSVALAQRAPPVPKPADFPCPGCILRLPSSASVGPRPLLVALHGDGGAMLPLVRAWQNACDEAGVILLAPRCPRELGCATQSYWQWLAGRGHDERWLGGLIDAVAARHEVDPARIYATGYSGGATYLGWYVPKHGDRFAAIAHIAGGAPLGGTCPACKVPVLFAIGATDPMIDPYTAPLRRFYEACGGHDVTWETIPGVTHESILGHLHAGRAQSILGWLLARKASCVESVDAGTIDAGVADASAISPREIDASAPSARELDGGTVAPSPPIRVPPSAGCACQSSEAPSHQGRVLAVFVWTAIGLARRRTSRMRSRAQVATMPA